MESQHIVVVGGSAGGVEALRRLVATLPHDFPAAIVAVIHFPPDAISMLPDILRRAGKLPAEHARDGEPLEAGRIYVGPPDAHAIVSHGKVELGCGPRENGHRPAIDP